MTNHYLFELSQSKKNVLLLQGPIGPFFKNLSIWLKQSGCQVYKINFNGGDEHFYPKESISFCQKKEEFAPFLKHYIKEKNIDAVVVFGDCRAYHQIAKSVVDSDPNLSFWAFEEGYLRPHYITFEKNGVNGFSLLSKEQEFYKNIEITAIDERKGRSHFYSMVLYAITYYLWLKFKKNKYQYYQHHRNTSLSFYASRWALAFIRKTKAKFKQAKLIKSVVNNEYKPFYIFPLQCNNDFQIKVHSKYHSMESYICRVIRSFARFADSQSYLLIKHHPMDEGFNDYTHIINELSKRYGVEKRVIYIHGVPMPILLRKGIGMVTINSTCGLSALIHGMPVVALGNANYDIKGLTFQDGLDRFWQEGQKPDAELFKRYRSYLCNKSQIKGSLYYPNFNMNIN